MTVQERDKIIEITRKAYALQGCKFPEDSQEMIEYLAESEHPAELGCLEIALISHKVYTGEGLSSYDFFDWHGL